LLPTKRYADGTFLKVCNSSQGPYWSLLGEISESEDRKIHDRDFLEATIQGLLAAQILTPKDEIVSTFYRYLPYGYPTPTLDRDDALSQILPYLEQRNVFTRGRFGSWKYEVGNQDHSYMLGVEAVDRILESREEITLNYPDIVNSGKHKLNNL
jgi:hypothetical protein